jgi:hypothetical protein
MDGTRSRRWILLVAGVALAAMLSVLGAATAATSTNKLPDLGMAPLADFKIDRNSEGHRVLRYSAIITNTGDGPFEAFGKRSSTSTTDMTVTQRVYNSSGGFTDYPSSARMYYAGDGHDHWHVRDLEVAELTSLDNGNKVGTGAKHGFCFQDNTDYRRELPGAPWDPVYTGCGGPNDLSVAMGLSVGWGDAYFYYLRDQYIDIEGVKPGRYRLKVTADGLAQFRETNEANNVTWVDLQIKSGNTPPKVIRWGPHS